MPTIRRHLFLSCKVFKQFPMQSAEQIAYIIGYTGFIHILFLSQYWIISIISFFWPLGSFIIDFLHLLFFYWPLWINGFKPSSLKESQWLSLVLTNYWSNHFFIPLLAQERLFCVQWIYLHCVSSRGTKYTCEWFSRLHAVFEI